MSERPWVLDTNVVLDLFHFDDPLIRPLHQAMAAGAIRCVASPATLAEWLRVLGYPEFGLAAAAQAACYARYADRVTTRPDTAAEGLPRCRDEDDQKFLNLAAASGAAVLVSRDRALLDLQRHQLGFAILTPARAIARLAVAP